MKHTILLLIFLVVFLFSACKESEKTPPEPPSVTKPMVESAVVSEAEPAFSYTRLPHESSKDYLVRVIEHEKPEMEAQIALEQENQAPIYPAPAREQAERNYPLYNYHHSETSPYQDGTLDMDPDMPTEVFAETFFYPQLGMTACYGMEYSPSIACVNYHFPYNMCIWGRVISAEGTLRLEVIDSYWGEAAPGDVRPLPQIDYRKAHEHMVEGSEWFLMGAVDGNHVFSVNAYTVYRVDDGKVKSLTYYNDFLQYDGWAPEELALQVRRIQAKYCSN
ncbi:MAG: hypothetical protein IJB51_05685 [Clostridia bacterium]|nr:hypothetical protein [Clostridia bacterium]